MRLPRFHRKETKSADEPGESTVVLELDSDQLRQMSALFAAPRWLRDLGLAAWFLVGAALLVVGLTWLVGLTSAITGPVILGLILATVTSPAVSWLEGHGWPRWTGALTVLLALVALFVLMLVLVIGGLVSESDEISAAASSASDKIQGWLEDVGVSSDGASETNEELQSSVPQILSTLAHGVVSGIGALTSLAFFLSFTMFSVFFLLKDGPKFRRWTERHLGVPDPIARLITGGVITSLRRYFLGVTIVAAFNAIVVGTAAYLLDVPLAGTIAVVTFVLAYIPFVGAFISGAFAVILALGSQGTETALIMLVVVILANGLLQNIVQPIAFGATLQMNPLLVLVVTISAGALFGMVGMILAAPLTSAAIHITANVAAARAIAGETPEPETTSIPLVE
jgi:predicted PurR-regulated permease PerM